MQASQLDRLLALGKIYWPGMRLYLQQKEMVESVILNSETLVVAGNQLGKDYTAGFIAVTFFLCPQMYFPEEYVREVERQVGNARIGISERLIHTRRVITTSVAEDHLRVLWAEIARYLSTSAIPLLERDGGPLVVNYQEIRFVEERQAKNPTNYLLGMVSEKGEKMSGHHAAYTLCIADEASGVDNKVYEHAQGWAKRFLGFGNAWPCQNFFFDGVQKGDILVT